ncbi:hypothetical protein E6O75_ATG05512 [Venturia nashicola]|uniref:Uncharacterized protein n=1 Tax=Venturia nashicola TaxID=86259 RepID=A0A4Z1P0K6_9PEZI|nr:hypothetical protein E6O75_ATG05512 [Venturia nashicola]
MLRLGHCESRKVEPVRIPHLQPASDIQIYILRFLIFTSVHPAKISDLLPHDGILLVHGRIDELRTLVKEPFVCEPASPIFFFLVCRLCRQGAGTFIHFWIPFLVWERNISISSPNAVITLAWRQWTFIVTVPYVDPNIILQFLREIV